MAGADGGHIQAARETALAGPGGEKKRSMRGERERTWEEQRDAAPALNFFDLDSRKEE